MEKTKESRKMEGDDKVVTDNNKKSTKSSDRKKSTKSVVLQNCGRNRDG